LFSTSQTPLAPFSTYGSAKKSLILIAASKANLEADRPPLLANTPLAMISNANHNNNLMLSFVVWSKKFGTSWIPAKRR
jgi:hypothetical protein